jgi:hypothetical protein
LQNSHGQTQSLHRVHAMDGRNPGLCAELPGLPEF